jgi:hypothetical protein
MRHFIAIVQVGLLAWSAYWHSPVGDEVANLPAGVSYWQLGSFDVNTVNPPLSRLIAGLPAAVMGAELDWASYRSGPGERPEWSMAEPFIKANAEHWPSYFVAGRFALLPLVLLGGYVCHAWARELYGQWAGFFALCLWAFSPEILGWGPTIMADVSAAALGVLAGYCFWKWLREPLWPRTLLAGLTLGLVELTKMTWVVLFPLWPALWLAWAGHRRRELISKDWRQQGIQMVVILLVGVYIVNLGYLFEGSFRQLENYTFVSRTLAGADALSEDGPGGNRFTGTWLGRAPVPLPRNYLSGMDLQKLDFEQGMPSYLNGEWKDGGWWYYYLVCAALRVPLGTWALGFLALGVTIWSIKALRVESQALEPDDHSGHTSGVGTPENRVSGGIASAYWAGWHHELVLLAPAAVIFVFASSQTGFSHTFRYVLPCFPFLFVWISKVAKSFDVSHWSVALCAGLALLWSVTSSLSVYPHSMSYFNELAGGPRNGHRYLLDINGGQDVWYLKEWYDAHPDARPLHAVIHSIIDLKYFGITTQDVPTGPGGALDLSRQSLEELRRLGPQPGWYAMSVYRLHDDNCQYDYFLRYFHPVQMIGYSIYIYWITPEEADCARQTLGLPPLELVAPGDSGS